MKTFSWLCFWGVLVQALHFVSGLPATCIPIEISFELARWSALLDAILWFVFPLACVFALPLLVGRVCRSPQP